MELANEVVTVKISLIGLNIESRFPREVEVVSYNDEFAAGSYNMEAMN